MGLNIGVTPTTTPSELSRDRLLTTTMAATGTAGVLAAGASVIAERNATSFQKQADAKGVGRVAALEPDLMEAHGADVSIVGPRGGRWLGTVQQTDASLGTFTDFRDARKALRQAYGNGHNAAILDAGNLLVVAKVESRGPEAHANLARVIEPTQGRSFMTDPPAIAEIHTSNGKELRRTTGFSQAIESAASQAERFRDLASAGRRASMALGVVAAGAYLVSNLD